MKRPVKLSPRAALFIGAALLATPAFAQDAPTQTVTPPPVVSTTPATPAPAPAPTIQFAPAAPQVQQVPATPEPAPARAETRTTTTTRTQARTQPRTTVTRQTTTSTAPAAPAAAAPEPAAPAEAAPVPVEATAPPPVTEVAPTTVQTSEIDAQTSEAAPTQAALWPWLAGGALIVLAALAFLLLRRRREEEEVYYEEPYVASEDYAGDPELIAARAAREEYREELGLAESIPPAIHAAPAVVAAQADAAEDAEIVRADADDVAGLTSAAPVAKRPWLEFGMRPVRAGTSSDEALVDIELTVANAGDIDAKDVRISTFLLSEREASEMENMLLERPESSVPPVTIPAGRGTRVDATLALRKDGLGEEFTPVVVADARYTMADGSEGRTSATFRVGLWNEGDGLEPIATGDREMHHNVAAELHGTPAHA
ncbi:hypothetical protein [Sphingomonas sp. G-3-2-10]|uniref:hypothetical protein n=1 Tax=Sphingomonas sp. G-3-2-10 TaxID=2728838 RepID=UPI00146DC36C|nr:hypothetical protein [Sphingomonas sp. G-3-2-10]NML05614.1 hypothetical protein [Sphingomonas sp. G-3-2-10]